MKEFYRNPSEVEKQRIVEQLKPIYKNRMKSFCWKAVLYGIMFYAIIMLPIWYYSETMVLEEAGFGIRRPVYSTYENYIMNQLFQREMFNTVQVMAPEDFDYGSINYKNSNPTAVGGYITNEGMIIAKPAVSKSSIENYDEVSKRARKEFNKYVNQKIKETRSNHKRELFGVYFLVIVGPVIIAGICVGYRKSQIKKLQMIEEGQFLIQSGKLIGREAEKTRRGSYYFVEIAVEDGQKKKLSVTSEQYDLFESGKKAYVIKIDDNGKDLYDLDVVWKA